LNKQKRPTGGNRQGVKEWLAHEEQYQPKQLYCTTSGQACQSVPFLEVETWEEESRIIMAA
jgi:hypothetical protein